MDERSKGTSPVVISEIVRRVLASKQFAVKPEAGAEKVPRARKPSDDLKSFHALVPRVMATTMKLEDFPPPIIYRYYQKYGFTATEELMKHFRKCAEILGRYADTAQKVFDSKGKEINP